MGRGFSRSHTGLSEIKAKVLDDKSKLATVKSNEKIKVKEKQPVNQTQNGELRLRLEHHSLFRKRRNQGTKSKRRSFYFLLKTM